jgi:hypothetical protein
MPQDDHPGFAFWDPNDINHPFPVGGNGVRLS